MTRRKSTKILLSRLKRGLTSLFVLAAVTVPMLTIVQWKHAFAGPSSPKDTRMVVAQLPFATRAVDDTAKAPDLFNEPLISVTFDDGWESVYTTALPLLNRYGIRTTQYIIAGDSKQTNYLSDAQIKDIYEHGQEIGSHTMTHKDLITLNEKDLTYQLRDSQTSLRKLLGSTAVATDFAAPYGSANDYVNPYIAKYYRSNRNTNGDYKNGVNEYDVNVAGQFNPYDIIGVTIERGTTVEDLKQLVAYAKAHNGWLVLTYHQADDHSNTDKYGLDARALEAQLRYLSSTNVRIATMGQVMGTVNPKAEY